MADSLGTAVLELDVDSRKFNDGIGDAEKKSKGLGSALGDVAKIAGGVALGAGLTQLPGLISGMVGSASDLNESLSKVRVVFGESSPEIEKWASTASGAFGQSKQQALEAVGTFGNFLQAMGQTPAVAGDMSKSMVELAADLGSFNNADPTEVILALRAGLSGEAEPMKKFGVALSEAAVSAKGVELGLVGVGEKMTEQQKITARYAIIMAQTATAQGDFARTSNGHANQMKILQARLADVRAEIGTALLPIVVSMGTAFLGLIEKVAPLIPVLTELITKGIAFAQQGIGAAIQAILPYVITFGMVLRDQVLPALMALWQNDVLPKLEAFGAVMRDVVIPAVIALASTLAEVLGPALIAVFTFIGEHKEILAAVAIAIGVVLVAAFVAWAVSAAAAAIATIAAMAPLLILIATLSLLVLGIILLVKHWDDITAKIPLLGMAFDALKVAISATATFFTETIPSWFEAAKAAIGATLEAIKAATIATWDALVAAVKATADFFTETIPGWYNDLRDKIGEAVDAIRDDVIDKWNAIKSFFTDSVWGFISDTVPGWFGDARDKIEGVVGSLRDSVVSMFNDLVSGVTGAINLLVRGLNVFIRGVRSIRISIPGFSTPGIPGITDGIHFGGISVGAGWINEIPELAAGAWAIKGGSMGRDSVPAMLAPGEMVIPQSFADGLRAALSGRDAGAGKGDVVLEIAHMTVNARDPDEARKATRNLGWGVQQNLRARGIVA